MADVLEQFFGGGGSVATPPKLTGGSHALRQMFKPSVIKMH
jgi:hypothetical protein